MLASRFASAMVGNINRVEAGRSSGEVRHQSMVDNKIFAAVKENNPDVAELNFWLEKVGLGELADPAEMKYVIKALEKYGLGSLLGAKNTGSMSNNGRM